MRLATLTLISRTPHEPWRRPRQRRVARAIGRSRSANTPPASASLLSRAILGQLHDEVIGACQPRTDLEPPMPVGAQHVVVRPGFGGHDPALWRASLAQALAFMVPAPLYWRSYPVASSISAAWKVSRIRTL